MKLVSTPMSHRESAETAYGVDADGSACRSCSSNGQHGNAVDETFRTPDIMPTILDELKIPLTHSVDGTAHKLK